MSYIFTAIAGFTAAGFVVLTFGPMTIHSFELILRALK
jgi:hypothetical protein